MTPTDMNRLADYVDSLAELARRVYPFDGVPRDVDPRFVDTLQDRLRDHARFLAGIADEVVSARRNLEPEKATR